MCLRFPAAAFNVFLYSINCIPHAHVIRNGCKALHHFIEHFRKLESKSTSRYFALKLKFFCFEGLAEMHGDSWHHCCFCAAATGSFALLLHVCNSSGFSECLKSNKVSFEETNEGVPSCS